MDDHQSQIDSNRAGRLIGLAFIVGGIALAIYMVWTAISTVMYPASKVAGLDPLPQVRWEQPR